MTPTPLRWTQCLAIAGALAAGLLECAALARCRWRSRRMH